jgi:hypothetical protein
MTGWTSLFSHENGTAVNKFNGGRRHEVCHRTPSGPPARRGALLEFYLVVLLVQWAEGSKGEKS